MKRLILFSLLAAHIPAFAQNGLNPADILKSLSEQWTTYSGDYTGKRYSSLKAVNASTVNRLSLSWVSRFATGCGPTGSAATGGGGGFGGRGGGESAAPIIVGGLGNGDAEHLRPRAAGRRHPVRGRHHLRVVAGQRLGHRRARRHGALALLLEDARRHQPADRGLGMWHNYIYFELHDDWVVCLDARTGKEVWKKEISSFDQQYFSSNAPMVIGDHVIVGTGNDMDAPGLPQVTRSRNRRTPVDLLHVPQNRRRSRRRDLGQPRCRAARRRRDLDSRRLRSGNAPLHLRHRQSDAGLHHGRGEGDNLFTCSLVAVNVDTGKMAWYYQTSPHDTHDWDSTQTPILADMPFNGRTRKLVMTATRNGYFFVLDRVTGEHLVTSKFGLRQQLGVRSRRKGPAEAQSEQGRDHSPDRW